MKIIVEKDKRKAEKLFEEAFGKEHFYALDRIKTKDFSSHSWIIVPKGYNAYSLRFTS